MASTEGALPFGEPGVTAGNSWTGIQANTSGLSPNNGINSIVQQFTRSDFREMLKITPTLIDKYYPYKSGSWIHVIFH